MDIIGQSDTYYLIDLGNEQGVIANAKTKTVSREAHILRLTGIRLWRAPDNGLTINELKEYTGWLSRSG